jgi:hypothetical protein
MARIFNPRAKRKRPEQEVQKPITSTAASRKKRSIHDTKRDLSDLKVPFVFVVIIVF